MTAQAHAQSYYAATARDQTGFPRFGGELDVDVAIVGGGFTGVATALELAERGLKVALCEANRIGWGATGRNGGQVTGSLSGDAAMLREFRRSLGDDAAAYVWDLRWRGHDIIKDRIKRYDIACDLKFGHLQTAMRPGHMAALEQMYQAGYAAGMADDLTLLGPDDIGDYLGTDCYVGGLLNRRNMHLHSLDLCVGEARAAQRTGALIFEDSAVTQIVPGRRPALHTRDGRIRADHVVLAGNAYHLLAQAQLRGKLFPASLANMATAPLDPAVAKAINPHDLAVYDSRFILDYYRLTADNRLMFGSGTAYSGRDAANPTAGLRHALDRVFPQLKHVGVDFAWSGHDGIILNRIPQVGRLDGNVLYVQGYSGHGIALSHILAEAVAKALTDDPFDFDVFANVRHWHLPVGRRVGSLMLALGMTYFRLRDRVG